MTRPRQLVRYSCPEHPGVLLLCAACLGTRGGRRSTPAKAAAARRNWQKALAGLGARRASARAPEVSSA